VPYLSASASTVPESTLLLLDSSYRYKGGRKDMLNKRNGKANKGFTLIELMIVVAIIGILAAIAIPKFADLIRKSNEGATRGNLGAIRSSLSIYYGDMEGQFPGNIDALTINQKYLKSVPLAKVPPHHADAATWVNTSSTVQDAGGWAYNNQSLSTNFGSLWVRCTHTDTKSKSWTEY
jgi:prepilin-type N-terminal cleavage/methylation domain-containing protein